MTFAAAHLFRPDYPGEPGYRPRCLDCGRERRDHPHVPAPRRPPAPAHRTEESTDA